MSRNRAAATEDLRGVSASPPPAGEPGLQLLCQMAGPPGHRALSLRQVIVIDVRFLQQVSLVGVDNSRLPILTCEPLESV